MLKMVCTIYKCLHFLSRNVHVCFEIRASLIEKVERQILYLFWYRKWCVQFEIFRSSNVDICYEIRASSNKKVEVYTTTLSTEGCFDYLTIRCEDSSKTLRNISFRVWLPWKLFSCFSFLSNLSYNLFLIETKNIEPIGCFLSFHRKTGLLGKKARTNFQCS